MVTAVAASIETFRAQLRLEALDAPGCVHLRLRPFPAPPPHQDAAACSNWSMHAVPIAPRRTAPARTGGLDVTDISGPARALPRPQPPVTWAAAEAAAAASYKGDPRGAKLPTRVQPRHNAATMDNSLRTGDILGGVTGCELRRTAVPCSVVWCGGAQPTVWI